MTNFIRRRQILFSPPVLFIWATLFAGLIAESLNEPPFSWPHAMSFGIPLGLLNTAMTLRGLQRMRQSIGLTSNDELWHLYEAVSKRKLPKDPILLAALPAYIEEREKPRKNAIKVLPLMLIFFAIFMAVAIGSRRIAPSIMALVFLALGIYGYRVNKKTEENIAILRKKLRRIAIAF
jgi:hypothetical protein